MVALSRTSLLNNQQEKIGNNGNSIKEFGDLASIVSMISRKYFDMFRTLFYSIPSDIFCFDKNGLLIETNNQNYANKLYTVSDLDVIGIKVTDELIGRSNRFELSLESDVHQGRYIILFNKVKLNGDYIYVVLMIRK